MNLGRLQLPVRGSRCRGVLHRTVLRAYLLAQIRARLLQIDNIAAALADLRDGMICRILRVLQNVPRFFVRVVQNFSAALFDLRFFLFQLLLALRKIRADALGFRLLLGRFLSGSFPSLAAIANALDLPGTPTSSR